MTTNKQEMKHPLADRLDTMMQCMFEYIQKSMLEPSTGQFSWERCRALYKDLLFTFDKYILSTYGSNHVQFIMFYMCSQRVQLAEGFLDYLWKKFTAINSSPITKQTCAYYIGSYLARAKYVSTEMCTASLQLMISWAHAYADKQAISQANYSDHASNFQLHRTYYSLCQTIFYVIIFRSRQLFDERFIDLVRTWKLNDIVSCKLNPLKYCFTAVCLTFIKLFFHPLIVIHSINVKIA
jgi:RNA polymerase I-specific transcription initiation factor RRN3